MKNPLNRTALDVAVRDYVVQHILDNGLKAGDALPSEIQLAENLGVGRSSIREAVKKLQSLGIVEVRHGTGLFVRESNFDPLREIVGYVIRFNTRALEELGEIRFLLEGAAIEEVVSLIGPGDIQRLEDVLAAWRIADQEGKACDDLDNQFHHILYSPLGNNMLLMLLEEFWTVFAQVDDPLLHEEKPTGEELENHRSILEAVKARDADLAGRRLRSHFMHLQECIVRVRDKKASVDQ
ncbi:MAG: FCD domain-containing protein [Spirochaetota bacterium]